MNASANDPPSSPAISGGRDGAGRFGAGNRCGLGNRGNKAQAELRAYWMEAAHSPGRVQQAEEAIYQMMVAGDPAAARLWLEYSLGKPRPVEDDAVDEDRQPLVVGPPLPVGAN